MSIRFILAGTMLLGCGATSRAQFAHKPNLPRGSERVTIKQLKQQLLWLEAERSKLLQEYKPASAEIRQVGSRISWLKQQLKRGQFKPVKPVHPRSKVQLLSGSPKRFRACVHTFAT